MRLPEARRRALAVPSGLRGTPPGPDGSSHFTDEGETQRGCMTAPGCTADDFLGWDATQTCESEGESAWFPAHTYSAMGKTLCQSF